MKTITIYRVTITRAYMMSEQGTGFSLEPWTGDTESYQGSDDGGEAYILPEGFEVAEAQHGGLELYDAKGQPATLYGAAHPHVRAIGGLSIKLKKAKS